MIVVRFEEVENILSKSMPISEWNSKYAEIFREGERVIEVSAPLEFPEIGNFAIVQIRNLTSGRFDVAKFKAEGELLKNFISRLNIYGFEGMIYVRGKVYYPEEQNDLWNSNFWYPGCGWDIPSGMSFSIINTF